MDTFLRQGRMRNFNAFNFKQRKSRFFGKPRVVISLRTSPQKQQSEQRTSGHFAKVIPKKQLFEQKKSKYASALNSRGSDTAI